MSLSTRVFHRQPDLTLVHLDGEQFALVDGRQQVCYTVHAGGAILWELVDGRRTVAEISQAAAEYFPGAAEPLPERVAAGLEELAHLGVLLEDQGPLTAARAAPDPGKGCVSPFAEPESADRRQMLRRAVAAAGGLWLAPILLDIFRIHTLPPAEAGRTVQDSRLRTGNNDLASAVTNTA